jgi:hypothetical protein
MKLQKPSKRVDARHEATVVVDKKVLIVGHGDVLWRPLW